MNTPPATQRKHPGFQLQQQRHVFHSAKQTAGREGHIILTGWGGGTTDADAESKEDQKPTEYRGQLKWN